VTKSNSDSAQNRNPQVNPPKGEESDYGTLPSHFFNESQKEESSSLKKKEESPPLKKKEENDYGTLPSHFLKQEEGNYGSLPKPKPEKEGSSIKKRMMMVIMDMELFQSLRLKMKSVMVLFQVCHQ